MASEERISLAVIILKNGSQFNIIRDMPTKTAVPKTRKKAAPKTMDFVNIDFPRPHEKVSPGHYTIRVNANLGTPNVVVSIDGAEHACRHASGFWWCDWQATPGRHTLTARKPETAVTTRMRRFQVVRNGEHTN